MGQDHTRRRNPHHLSVKKLTAHPSDKKPVLALLCYAGATPPKPNWRTLRIGIASLSCKGSRHGLNGFPAVFV
jgi:hypothetical protein